MYKFLLVSILLIVVISFFVFANQPVQEEENIVCPEIDLSLIEEEISNTNNQVVLQRKKIDRIEETLRFMAMKNEVEDKWVLSGRKANGVYNAGVGLITINVKDKSLVDSCKTFLHELGHKNCYDLEKDLGEICANTWVSKNEWRCEGI